jgi:hypothetical protein
VTGNVRRPRRVDEFLTSVLLQRVLQTYERGKAGQLRVAAEDFQRHFVENVHDDADIIAIGGVAPSAEGGGSDAWQSHDVLAVNLVVLGLASHRCRSVVGHQGALVKADRSCPDSPASRHLRTDLV